ncbi:protein WVD2-like protein 4 [Cinnamomum micranthum f. kanehirae]|uniref:Protein WVD2-like protein 4 n=1 Tax=Cinnamomum micranthum f. kanehirae TaxID=337451 RepID=A0A443NP87_9MAGN|nr:protein WVD2-like protein 4 [Cinnamomum micranthum f. kanehirae]
MTFPSKQNLGLSQSLASPSRGILTSSSLRTSNADKQKKKPHVKDSHMNGNKSMPLVPNGRSISTFQSSNSSKNASAGVGSRGASNGAVSSKQNTLASSKTSVWRSKSVPTNAIVNSAASKAHISTASHGLVQHRGNGSGFPLRSNERAEKRKPLPKLEEKIHRKEVGKTNLQEKSKKSKEAEMKQQRKSLAVKATPMPCAKLPTARPKPRTQGQSKSYVAVTDCSHTGGGSSRRSSSNSSLDRSNKTYDRHPQIAGHGDSTSSNKPVPMFLSKLPSQKASVVVKLNLADSCSKTLTKCGGKEQNLMKCVEDSPPRVELELFSILDDDEDDEVIISLPDPP